jgi:hypothetical protein
MNPHVSLIIPTETEADCIADVLAMLRDDVVEVVVADDASDGMAAGLAECSGDMVVMLDPEARADAAEVARFVDALAEGAGYARLARAVGAGS